MYLLFQIVYDLYKLLYFHYVQNIKYNIILNIKYWDFEYILAVFREN